MHEGLAGLKKEGGNGHRVVKKINDVAVVYEMKKDGTFRDVFRGSGFRDSWVNNQKVIEFCSKYPNFFSEYATFFKVGCNIVAVTKNKSGTVSLNSFSLDYPEKFDLEKNPRRVVVPLGNNKEEQLELFN